jgi:hypothetical protein
VGGNYRIRFNDALSMIGSIGIGERLQVSGEGDDIPYYLRRTGADLKLTKVVTWNVVAFRYRDAFDSSDDYLTPQPATGFNFKVGEARLDFEQDPVQLEGLGSV